MWPGTWWKRSWPSGSGTSAVAARRPRVECRLRVPPSLTYGAARLAGDQSAMPTMSFREPAGLPPPLAADLLRSSVAGGHDRAPTATLCELRDGHLVLTR